MDDFGGSHGELATGRRDWRLYLFAAFIAATISIVSTNARNAGGEGRFRSSEAVYRGRGSAREFFMRNLFTKNGSHAIVFPVAGPRHGLA
jgi:hypothetical protein